MNFQYIDKSTGENPPVRYLERSSSFVERDLECEDAFLDLEYTDEVEYKHLSEEEYKEAQAWRKEILEKWLGTGDDDI